MTESSLPADPLLAATKERDLPLLDYAIAVRYGTATALARALQRSRSAVSHWRQVGRLPALVRTVLMVELGLKSIPVEAWMNKDFQRRREATKAIECILMAFHQNKLKGPKWAAVQADLEALCPWEPNDWRRILEKNIDHVARLTKFAKHDGHRVPRTRTKKRKEACNE